MSLSLHRAVVPGFLQRLGAMAALVDKAEAHSDETGIAPAELLASRLAPDMYDLAYQVKSVAVHSWGAIEGVRRGGFSPDTSEPGGFAELRTRIGEARSGLECVDAAELDTLMDAEIVFSAGERFRRPFTVANFLLGFSVPNCHFHATAAYALLRARGLAIGKVDYLGAMPIGYPA